MVLLLSGATAFLGLINPYLTKLLIDKAYANRALGLFIILTVIGSTVFVLNGIITSITSYLNNYIKLRVNFNLNLKVFKKLQNLPYGFFQASSTGENLYKISYDVERVGSFITDTLPQAVFILPKMIFILTIVFYLNWKMALFVLMLAPVLYIAPYYFTKQTKKALKGWIELSQGIFKQLQEMLTHIHLVKAFGRESYETRHYVKNSIEKIRLAFKKSKLEINTSFANNLAQRMTLGLVTFYGGYQLIKGRITLGSLSAITIYLNQLLGLQGTFASFLQQVSFSFASCERADSILDSQPELMEDKNAEEKIFPKGGIEFRNAAFGYTPDKMVIESLSFLIEGGSSIGLVGPSGCGKTTLVNLILRLYKLYNGQILLDSCDVMLIKSKALYSQIGVVLQESYLWNDSIENNIKYGREEADLKEVAGAAEIACIDDFINSLPQGYNTVIGENACKISEGQKQRIAIARAVIKRPKILILDEALSSLDAQVENRIIDNIRNSLSGSTLIAISHRLSTIKKMDLVYFLAGPDKIDISTHEELVKNNPKYQAYLAHQLKKEELIFGSLP